MLYIDNHEVFYETIQYYSQLRRSLCDSFYELPEDFEHTIDYEHFVKAANLIYQMAAKPKEFIAIQFRGADMYHYPTPKDLHHSTSEKRWRLFLVDRDIDAHIELQEIYLSKLLEAGFEVSEAIVSETPFAAWFRLRYLKHPSGLLKAEGVAQVRNPRLLRKLVSKGYNTKKILRWRWEDIV